MQGTEMGTCNTGNADHEDGMTTFSRMAYDIILCASPYLLWLLFR